MQLGGDINGFVAWASGVMTKIRKALQTAKVEGRTVFLGKSVQAWMEKTGATWATAGTEMAIPASRPNRIASRLC